MSLPFPYHFFHVSTVSLPFSLPFSTILYQFFHFSTILYRFFHVSNSPFLQFSNSPFLPLLFLSILIQLYFLRNNKALLSL